MKRVDVVIVSYNSRDRLRAAVAPLAALDGVNVIVADNASSDDSLAVLEGLPVTTLAMPRNGGFAYGVNAAWRSGTAPFVLVLNPDAAIDAASLGRLVGVLEADERVGIAAPRILNSDGSLDFSLRYFPRKRSLYAQALFLHRIFPRASWSDETVRVRAVYERPGAPDWVSGACMLVRRAALEQVGGLDEGYFLYREDADLCRRVREAGYDIRFEPQAVAVHAGGASAPRPRLAPVLAASRARYADRYETAVGSFLARAAIALSELTHVVICHGGREVRAGHARAFCVVAAGLLRGRSSRAVRFRRASFPDTGRSAVEAASVTE